MAGPFAGINMANQALRSFQRAMNTVGHNLANVNTPGYSRQRVSFAANEPIRYFELEWKSLGQGVSVTSIGRLRDGFLEAQGNGNRADLGRSSAAAAGLSEVERLYGEPGPDGIDATLGKFFDAWSNLAANPSDAGARLQVRAAGQSLADKVRGAWQSLEQQRVETAGQIETTFDEIDRLAVRIESLNRAIQGSGTTPEGSPDLLDQRDEAIRQLSELTDVRTFAQPDGSVSVIAAGFSLVDSAGARAFPRTYDSAAGTISEPTATYPVRGGRLAGLFVANNALVDQQGRLDTLANQLRTQVNAVHTTGTNLNGNTNVRFFNDNSPQTGAADFDLTGAVKGDLDEIVTGLTNRPGDGGLAQSIADMRDASFTGLGGRTFRAYWQNAAFQVAGDRAYFDGLVSSQTAVSEQIANRVSQVSGVSLDDEMADLVRFQRSYQAAARALTVFDQTAEDLIGMLRR